VEVVRGVQEPGADKPRVASVLSWFVGLVATDLVEILTLDLPAAIVAGRLRAMHPTPPTGARRKGVKPEQCAGWVLDIQIGGLCLDPRSPRRYREPPRLRDPA
jgi:hypothetical protein